jgi:HSP20 family protein
MSLVQWSPFREMETLQSEMNRLFSRFNGDGENSRAQNGGQWMLPVDVSETKDALKLKAAVPGVDPKDVNIEVNENVLTINAERRYQDEGEDDGYRWIEQQYGSFNRSVTLPSYADADNIEASYNNGVLELTVPKKESAKPRRIELKNGSNEPQAIESGSKQDK